MAKLVYGFELERRECKNPRCPNIFKVFPSSPQKYCNKLCERIMEPIPRGTYNQHRAAIAGKIIRRITKFRRFAKRQRESKPREFPDEELLDLCMALRLQHKKWSEIADHVYSIGLTDMGKKISAVLIRQWVVGEDCGHTEM